MYIYIYYNKYIYNIETSIFIISVFLYYILYLYYQNYIYNSYIKIILIHILILLLFYTSFKYITLIIHL